MSHHPYVKAELAAFIRIAGNLLLALAKGIVGWLANSSALIADALHTASYGIRNLAALVRLQEDRPRGGSKRRKASRAWIVGAAAILLVAGIELGWSTVSKLQQGSYLPVQWFALPMAMLSIILKGIAGRSRNGGERKELRSMQSNKWDHKLSYAGSLMALIGSAGAWGSGWLQLPLIGILDPLAAIAITLLVLRSGYRMLYDTRPAAGDQALEQEDVEELIRTAQRVKGVIAVDDLKAYEQGHFVLVELQVSVNPQISVSEGNDIARLVKHHLMKRFMHIADVLVNVQPYDGGYPYRNAMEHDLENRTLLH